MINYSRQNVNSKDVKSVVETLKSPWLTSGPKIEEFQKKYLKSLDQNIRYQPILQLVHYIFLVYR